jgi:hypothetical protein
MGALVVYFSRMKMKSFPHEVPEIPDEEEDEHALEVSPDYERVCDDVAKIIELFFTNLQNEDILSKEDYQEVFGELERETGAVYKIFSSLHRRGDHKKLSPITKLAYFAARSVMEHAREMKASAGTGTLEWNTVGRDLINTITFDWLNELVTRKLKEYEIKAEAESRTSDAAALANRVTTAVENARSQTTAAFNETFPLH